MGELNYSAEMDVQTFLVFDSMARLRRVCDSYRMGMEQSTRVIKCVFEVEVRGCTLYVLPTARPRDINSDYGAPMLPALWRTNAAALYYLNEISQRVMVSFDPMQLYLGGTLDRKREQGDFSYYTGRLTNVSGVPETNESPDACSLRWATAHILNVPEDQVTAEQMNKSAYAIRTYVDHLIQGKQS